jgi:hypothetical protein
MPFLMLLAPFWRWIGGAAFILMLIAGIYAYGHHKGAASKEAEWQTKMAAEITRQAAVRAKALDNAVAREIARNTENASLEKQVQDYEQQIQVAKAAPAKPGACPPGLSLSPADVGELRRLQGSRSP